MTIRRTGGRWTRDDGNVYFIASDVDSLLQGAQANRFLLIAVNELEGAGDIDQIERWCDQGKRVFIDSGVFNLANGHAKAHDMTMDAALSMPPEKLDGFNKLFDDYCRVLDRCGEKVWGYIEIDQGGRANKIKTRNRLEAIGLSPIPVYHPFNDGWDYFDQLARSYDRICFGNIVQADRRTRLRLLATAWERRRRYPHLWIHLLGMTPNEWLNSYPIDSCDSSSWLRLVRWSAAARSDVALKPFDRLSKHWTYDFEADSAAPGGHRRARQLGGYKGHFLYRNWNALEGEYRDMGCDPRMTEC